MRIIIIETLNKFWCLKEIVEALQKITTEMKFFNMYSTNCYKHIIVESDSNHKKQFKQNDMKCSVLNIKNKIKFIKSRL